MSKISFENKVLLELYTKKLFEQDIKTITKEIVNDFAGDIDIGEKRIRDTLFTLKKKNAIIIKDDVVYENKEKTNELGKRHAFSKNYKNEDDVTIENVKLVKPNSYYGHKANQLTKGDMLLATVYKQSNDILCAKAHGGEFDGCVISPNELSKNAIGKTCLVKITSTNGGYMGEVEQVFGLVDDPITENVAIAAKYGFTTKFPQAVIDEARAISPVVTYEQKLGRTDLRHLNFVTIDPVGCKDKDDAIYDEALPDGSFRTYIAIADVSSGVKTGSELDKEAFKRGNSCYLGGGVYPMLPTELSNGIFSLDEDKDRLAVVVSAIIKPGDKKRIYDPRLDLAVIRVKKGYSYPESEKTHNNEEGFDELNKRTKEQIDLLYNNTSLIQKRYNSMLKPDSHEPEYKFGPDGSVVEDIKVSNEEYSHTVVEARMLLANEIVAQIFMEHKLLGLFRTHSESQDTKIEKLQSVLYRNKVDFELKNTTQSYLQLIDVVKNSPSRDYLMFEIIKSLSKAEYKATVNETSHFGLGINGSRGYIHFTSPIRRYADLTTHRLLKQILQMGKTNVSEESLEKIAEHLNVTEMNADKAEVESDQYLACLWAQKHMDDIYQGTITQISPSTLEVLHSNGVTRISIPTSKLKGAEEKPYATDFDCLSISNGKSTYKLGDKISFKIDKISLSSRAIFGNGDYKKVKKETLEEQEAENEMIVIK